MRAASAELRDPWVLVGLAALALATVAVVRLYQLRPQSVAEVRARGWVALRPTAYDAQLGRARERLAAARAALAVGRDAAADSALASAAAHADRARRLAASGADSARALELWARAMLDRAALRLRAGTGRGLRPDDNALLRSALGLVRTVQAAPLPPALRAEAQALQARIERQLRPGPLEWLPPPPRRLF